MKHSVKYLYILYSCLSGWYVPSYLIQHGYSLNQIFFGIFCIAIFNGFVGYFICKTINKN